MKSIFIRKIQYIPVLISIAYFFSGFESRDAMHRVSTKQNQEITLQDERIPISPKEFYIANITDERDNRDFIAWILPSVSPGDQLKAISVDFKGGGFTAIKHFIERGLPRDTSLCAINIGLKKFMVTETAKGSGRADGHIILSFSFDLERGDGETVHLTDYNGAAVYDRNRGPAQNIEPILRQALENGLIYLNKWIDQQANTNINLAKSVKISFRDYDEKPEGDTIYYSTKRPIAWSDFQSKTGDNKYEAEVYPTIGYDEHTDVVKGTINLQLVIKVCLPKSACWVKEGGRNDYALNHEQRHFDIAKIASEHFKQKIKAEKLPVDNFDGFINVAYLDSYREMSALQKQYDAETGHGTNRAEQEHWNEKIDRDLDALGVK